MLLSLPGAKAGYLFIIADLWYTDKKTRGLRAMEETRSDEALELMKEQTGGDADRGKFETVDYVRELFLNSEIQKKSEHKRLVLARVCMILLSVLTAAIVAACVIIVPIIKSVGDEANQALAVVQSLDTEALMADVDEFTQLADETFTSVGDAVSVLEELDIDTLNSAIAELETGVQKLNDIDVDALNEAIQNLNDSVEPFANFFNRYK